MITQKHRSVASAALMLLLPLVTYYLVEWLQGVCPNPTQQNFWLNLLVYYGFFLVFYGITRRITWSTILTLLLFLSLGIVNHFMINLRGKALLPWDFFAIGTAKNVASGLSLQWDRSLVATLLLAALLIVGAFFLRRAALPKLVRPIAGVCGVVCLALIWWLLWDAPASVSSDPWYTASASQQNGMAVNLIHNVKQLINLPPDGYSPERVRSIVGTAKVNGERNPDIIVIMDESFSDLSHIADLHTESDPIPFVHSLKENTISGFARVSVFGGGTCNTEYDFLTGNSSNMLRPGAYPMVQFISPNTPSLAQSLRKGGYHTVGIHPFYPDGWNRDQAYPKLGFDAFYSIADFKNPELVREYISDDESFRKIEATLEQSKKPTFVFNVTMQNHFGYDKAFANLTEDVVFPEKNDFPQTARYLALVKRTDAALSHLIASLKERKRPTILLFFGDHFPAIEEDYYKLLQERGGLTDAEMDERKHEVPFFIWANYPIGTQKNVTISASFLSPLLLELAGADMTPYQCYLRRLMKRMPVIDEGNTANAQAYHMVQYNAVFDHMGRQLDLFE